MSCGVYVIIFGAALLQKKELPAAVSDEDTRKEYVRKIKNILPASRLREPAYEIQMDMRFWQVKLQEADKRETLLEAELENGTRAWKEVINGIPGDSFNTPSVPFMMLCTSNAAKEAQKACSANEGLEVVQKVKEDVERMIGQYETLVNCLKDIQETTPAAMKEDIVSRLQLVDGLIS
jgi:hypothetical protein